MSELNKEEKDVIDLRPIISEDNNINNNNINNNNNNNTQNQNENLINQANEIKLEIENNLVEFSEQDKEEKKEGIVIEVEDNATILNNITETSTSSLSSVNINQQENIDNKIEESLDKTNIHVLQSDDLNTNSSSSSSSTVIDLQQQKFRNSNMSNNNNNNNINKSIKKEIEKRNKIFFNCAEQNEKIEKTIELFKFLNNNSSNLKKKFENLTITNNSLNINKTNKLSVCNKISFKNLSNSSLNIESEINKNNYLREPNLKLADSKSVDNLIITGNRNKTKHELATGYGFNEDQIGIFEETFQIFDKDCDGNITLVEIRTVMNALGFFPCDEMIRKSIQDIDNDNSGTVDFEEFICMMSKFRAIKTSHELDEELKEIFNIFDKNQDGFIDNDELKDVLYRLGEHITDDEVMDMIKEADIDGDNKVSFSEFKSILYDNKAR